MVRVDVGFNASCITQLDRYPLPDMSRLESQFLETQLRERIDVEALAQDGGFIFVDDASYFKDGKPSPELQKIVDQLQQRGAEVVILTSNNPDGLKSTIDLRDRITEKIGLGNYTKGTLKPRAIVCIFNTKNQNNRGEVVCVTGQAYEGVFSKTDVQKGVDLILQGIRNGNIDAGYTNAFSYFVTVFEQREAQATKQALPTHTPRPVEVTAQPERVVVQPQPGFIEQHPYEVGGGVFGMVTLIGAAALEYFTRPKRQFIAETEKQRRNAMTEYRQLSAAYGQTLTRFQQIEQALSESYPDQAERVRAERTKFEQEVEVLKRNAEQLKKNKVGFFRSNDDMRETRNVASIVLREAQQLMQATIEKRRQADDLSAREQAAHTNVDIAKAKLSEMESWYDQRLTAFRNILPTNQVALSGIKALFGESEQNGYFNPALALKGSDQAVQVVELLTKFQAAVEAFTKGYQISQALLTDSARDLQRWESQAINPMRLASTGIKLLNEAKAGISTTDKLVEVVKLSSEAEQELKSAKDFANGSATLFELQDTNNNSIGEITAKGFFNRHIASIRKNAQEVMAEANQLASQGEWKQAQSKLGLFKSHVDAALAEMQRLDQLKTKTDQDLHNITSRVEETRSQYQKETTPAWNDLQQYFVSGNYDETAKVWDVLRKGEKGRAIDFKGFHKEIDKILTELTDDSQNERDIASQATIHNSFEVQEFDKAAALVRQMEKKLADAQKLMSDLFERQQLARKAENEHKKAMTNAKARLKDAKESIDTQEEDRLVDAGVDTLIEQCEEMISVAGKAEDEKVFVAALEAATRATDFAIRARKSADEQIAQLKRKYAELAENKRRIFGEAESIIKSVEQELDVVITKTTTQAKQALERALSAVITKEKSLGALEDHDLEKGINTILDDLGNISGLARNLEQHLRSDQHSYDVLLNDLQNAIREADSAISSADSRCRHSYAGSAGDRALSSAQASKPDMAQRGTARSDIESRIRNAKSATDSASTAYSQASAAIRAEEDRLEAIERAERELEEARERDRQEAINRVNQAAREADEGRSNQASGEL